MLWWRMKSDVRNVYSWPDGHTERLDRAIEVLVIESVFIMVNTLRRIAHLVTHKPDAVVTRVRLNSADCCPSPSHDSRLLSRGGANGAKTGIRRAATYALLLIGNVVIHVALARMTLAPRVLMRDH